MPFIQPDANDVLPFRALQETLPNGLRVIIVPTGFPHLLSLQIPVQTGSRNEVEEGKSGFAHFFEHMMFRGTKRYPPERYQSVITRAGARQNAYTTDDYTNYHVTFAAEDLDEILEIEADRFMNLEYAEPEFRTEARAILGEYNKSASDPLTKLLEVQRDHAYRVHTYKHTTMGFLRDIEAMPEQFEYSRQFFERWYRPGYSTVVLAGDVEPESALAKVAAAFGEWKAGAPAGITIPREPQPGAPVGAHVDWPGETPPWLSIGFHGPAFSTGEADYAALDTLLDLSFGPTSDLYRELVEETQVVDQLFPWGGGHVDPGLFTVFARVKRQKDIERVRTRILETVAEARSQGPGPERLAEAKSNMRYSLARTFDNSETIAGTLARFVRYDREYDTLNRLFRRYDTLTPDDLQAAGERYLATERLVQATLSHAALPAAFLVPAAVPAVQAAERPALPDVVIRSASPLLRFKLLFAAGSADDPAGKEGLAELTASMIADAGSEARRYDEIVRALFPMAGGFSAQVDREMTTLTGSIHRDNAGKFLDLVVPMFTKPGFREEDFARLKDTQANALAVDLRSSNEEELGKEVLQSLSFPGSGYGHPAVGTVSGVAALTIDDVRSFAVSHLGSRRLTLGLSGDWPAEAEERLRKALAELPAGTTPAPRTIAAKKPHGMQVTVVEKDTRSVAISFGHPIEVTRSHPDFTALWLARSWLGEHRASNGRLFQQLREVRGLNYGNYAYVEAFPGGMYTFFPAANLGRRAQLFEVWIRPVQPQHAVFALKAALHEVRSLIANGLSEEEFEETRQYLSKNVLLMTKTQDQQLGYALDDRWYGIDGYIETMRRNLAALTRNGVNAAIRRHLDGENLHVAMIAGDAVALREELLGGGFTAIVYEAPKPAEVLAADQVIGALDLGLAPERVHVVPVADVFA